jgi:thiol-disulfide isomerase/thioredoxin
MIAVPGAVVDADGIMRRENTGELAIWHHRCKFHGPCERYTSGPENFVKLEEVVYIDGAPWCPDCVQKMVEDSKRKELHEMFRGNTESN